MRIDLFTNKGPFTKKCKFFEKIGWGPCFSIFFFCDFCIKKMTWRGGGSERWRKDDDVGGVKIEVFCWRHFWMAPKEAAKAEPVWGPFFFTYLLIVVKELGTSFAVYKTLYPPFWNSEIIILMGGWMDGWVCWLGVLFHSFFFFFKTNQQAAWVDFKNMLKSCICFLR